MAMDRSNVIVYLLFPRGQDSPLPDDDRTPGVFHGHPLSLCLELLKRKRPVFSGHLPCFSEFLWCQEP